MEDLQKILDTSKDESDEISFEDVMDVFKIMDPGIDDKMLQSYVARGFAESFEYLQEQKDKHGVIMTVSVTEFMNRMKTGVLSKSGGVKSSDLTKAKAVKNAQKRTSIIHALQAVTDKWEKAAAAGPKPKKLLNAVKAFGGSKMMSGALAAVSEAGGAAEGGGGRSSISS